MSEKIIGPFKFFLDQKLGQGSFGEVYKGFDSQTQQQVAIKCLPKRLLDRDDNLRENLFEEIKVMRKLNNPNIVQFLDVIETQNNYYIIQELCDSGDLAQFIKRKNIMNETSAIQFMNDILNGFIELIKNGIMHRDLKPANILLHQNRYKIADFGFSRNIENFENQLLKTIVGTPLYMSPQLLNGESYTNKADIWSLGFIFYEVLFGHTPWIGINTSDLLNNITTQQLKFPHQISDQLQDFINGCLQLEEKNRFSWTDIYNHPVFKNQFKEYIKFKQDLVDKADFIITDLRRHIQMHKIDLTELFTELDMNNNQVLSIKEFSVLLHKINKNLDRQQVEVIFNRIDENKSNSIEFEEFKNWLIDNNVKLSHIQKQTSDTKTIVHKQIQKQSSDTYTDYQKNPRQKQQQYQKSATMIGYPQTYQNFNQNQMSYSSNCDDEQYGMWNLAQKMNLCNDTLGITLIRKAINVHQLDLNSLFKKYDKSNTGQIRYDEFYKMLKRIDKNITDQDIQKAFNQIDRKNKGFFSFFEFQVTLFPNQKPNQKPQLAQYYK